MTYIRVVVSSRTVTSSGRHRLIHFTAVVQLWRTHQSRHRSQFCCTGSFGDEDLIGSVSKNSDVIVTLPFSPILLLWYRLWLTPQSRYRSQSWCTGSFDDVDLIGVVNFNRGVIMTSSFNSNLTSKRAQLRRNFPFITCMLTAQAPRSIAKLHCWTRSIEWWGHGSWASV